MTHRIFPFIFIAAVLCGSVTLRGQTTARVTGVVQSSAGRPVAGAKVTATGQNRDERAEAVTAEDGAFVFPQLSADTYQISASASGYSEYAAVVEVGVGQTRTVELKLNSLAESTVIAVSNDATADLSSARLSVNVTPLEVSDMPLNGRSYSILTLLAPGAANLSDGGFDKISFSGQPNGHNRYSFDGIDASSVIDPNPGWFPVVGTQFRLQTSIEDIQEFRVDTALRPAEYGLGAGGQVNVISKSGGGDLHGSAYEFFRHNDLAARDFFATGDDSRLRMNQYGGTAGGPIERLFGKDRAFFFVAFEKLAESSRVGGTIQVPTPLLMAISSPATVPILALQPLGASADPTALLGLANRSGMSRIGEWNGSARLDFNLPDGHKLAFRYVKARQALDTLDQTTVTPRYMQAYGAPDNGMASWTSVLGSVFNELKLGLNRAPTGLAYSTPVSWLSDVGIVAGQQSWMFGGVGQQAGGEYGQVSDYRSRSYSLIDTASWSSDRHSVKAGFELRAVRVPLTTVGGTVYSFTSAGFIADLGATVSYTGNLQAQAQQNLYSTFVQDEWRLRSDFTVNFGLRYEYYTPVSEADGRARVFDMNGLNYLPTGSSFYRAGKLGLAPRLALAWAPAALKAKTVFRTGAGVEYSPGPLRDLIGPIQNIASSYSAVDLSYPTGIAALNAQGMTVESPVGIDASARFPDRVYQWGFSVQQILPAQFTAQAGYVGSAGRNLETHRWGNLITGMTPYGQLLRQNPAFDEIAYLAGGGSANYHALQLQVNRRFAQDFLVGAQYSWSHNLTDAQSDGTTLQNPNCLRCDKGPADFDLRQSATIDAYYRVPLGRGARHWTGGAAGYLLAGWNLGSIFGIRTGAPVNVVLQRSDIAFVDAGGQEVAAGTPGAFPVLDTPQGGGTYGTLRPSVVAGVNPYLNQRLNLFNPLAFSVPQFGTYGNLGWNALRGPGFSQTDFQITRSFRFSDRTTLAFRVDCYNLLNQPNFAQPVATLINVSPVLQPGEAFTMAQLSNFGLISSTVGRNLGLGTSRQIQLGLRLGF